MFWQMELDTMHADCLHVVGSYSVVECMYSYSRLLTQICLSIVHCGYDSISLQTCNQTKNSDNLDSSKRLAVGLLFFRKTSW
mmetsp:Transcript_38447/g.121103  ORF Transcript_38447/g.121103 Transcript_38447/m.121103 type:complete len:82 (-) Transcript_38447:1114-1359(-)